jgi:hypothetical protein
LAYSSTLKMETLCFLEILVNFYRTSCCLILDDSCLHEVISYIDISDLLIYSKIHHRLQWIMQGSKSVSCTFSTQQKVIETTNLCRG